MKAQYETDVAAWAAEQTALLKAGRFDKLDLVNLAEEISDVGKSEQRELRNRMIILLAHLLKWEHQPSRRSVSWELTIAAQRLDIADVLEQSPSLRNQLKSPAWIDRTWERAVIAARQETGLGSQVFPDQCPWLMNDVIAKNWLPNQPAR